MNQLLDFAAAAAREAGLRVIEDAGWDWALDGKRWAPHEDPYQAMQLAGVLHLLVDWSPGRVIVAGDAVLREYGEDPLATACMAITRAAAQRGGWTE